MLVQLGDADGTVLVHKALCVALEGLQRLIGPPRQRVTVLVVLAPLVVEAVRALVSYHLQGKGHHRMLAVRAG